MNVRPKYLIIILSEILAILMFEFFKISENGSIFVLIDTILNFVFLCFDFAKSNLHLVVQTMLDINISMAPIFSPSVLFHIQYERSNIFTWFWDLRLHQTDANIFSSKKKLTLIFSTMLQPTRMDHTDLLRDGAIVTVDSAGVRFLNN